MKKDFLVGLIYCEMLGYKVTFGYMHALKMIADSNILIKKLGFLFFTYFLKILISFFD